MHFPFSRDISLQNKAVKLIPLCLEHSSVLFPITEENPDLLKYSPTPFGDADKLKKLIENNIALREQKKKYSFTILDRESNTYCGSTSYLNISMMHKKIEIGSTWLGKKFHGTAINKNCKFLLIQYAFETLGLERVEFKTDNRNVQSQKAIRKIGGVYEGTLRKHMIMSDGFVRDSMYYSILKSEWEVLKATIFKDASK